MCFRKSGASMHTSRLSANFIIIIVCIFNWIYDLYGSFFLINFSIQTSCAVPGCKFSTDSLLDFENHYNATHRYSCSQCKKVLPSPHLLDLHIQEKHDSFFAVMALKKPSVCKKKFINYRIHFFFLLYPNSSRK